MNYYVEEAQKSNKVINEAKQDYIENDYYKLSYKKGQLHLFDKKMKQCYDNILTFEDGGDEGDTYDYSPAHVDRVFDLTLEGSERNTFCGEYYQELLLTGTWELPKDLKDRAEGICQQKQDYELKITLKKGASISNVI